MTTRSDALPNWAITNVVLLLAPVAVGFGAFPSFRLWFIPAPALKLCALLLLIFYYAVVIYVCKRSSGARTWSLPKNLSLKEFLVATVGLLMFSFLAYHSFYAVGPAVVTSIIGARAEREFTISSVDSVNPSGSCGTKIWLVEAAPTLISGFCVPYDQVDENWAKGSRVTLTGKESVLGFHVARFGR
jgi:hypothetical protein